MVAEVLATGKVSKSSAVDYCRPQPLLVSSAELNTDYRFWMTEERKYHVVLSSDNGQLGGFDRPDEGYAYETYEHQLSLYLPSRVALVLARG